MYRLFFLGIISSAALSVTLALPEMAWAQDDDDLFKDLGAGSEEDKGKAPPKAEPAKEPAIGPETEPEPEAEPESAPEPKPKAKAKAKVKVKAKAKAKASKAGGADAEDLESELEELEGGPASPPKKAKEEKPIKGEAIEDASRLDRVKAVQRKPVLKQFRVETTPVFSVTLNDAFYSHFAVGGQVMFYPHDSFGIGISGTFFIAHPKSDNHKVVRMGQKGVAAVYYLAELATSIDVQWSPIYGKLALINKVIVPFDFYITAGVGFALAGGNIRPAFNAGLGQRLMINDWIALRVEVRDIVYNDTQLVVEQLRSDLQNYVLFTAGVSFFIPPSFEYAGL